MASRHLVLFATSDAPDPYVNSIAHAVAHLGVSSVEVIVISEHDYPAELSGSAWATRVSERVTAQIEALTTKTYIEYQVDKSGGTRQQLAGAETAAVYGTVLSVINKGGMAAKIIRLSAGI